MDNLRLPASWAPAAALKRTLYVRYVWAAGAHSFDGRKAGTEATRRVSCFKPCYCRLHKQIEVISVRMRTGGTMLRASSPWESVRNDKLA